MKIFHNVATFTSKKKGKVVCVHNMKAYMGSRNVARLILNLKIWATISLFPLHAPFWTQKFWSGQVFLNF